MSYDNPDPYYQPEAYGLTIYASAGDGGGYDWNVYLVFLHEDGRIFNWSGSGCSCWGPCEDITKLDQLNQVYSRQELLDDFDEWADLGDTTGDYHTYGNTTPDEVANFKTKVAELKF